MVEEESRSSARLSRRQRGSGSGNGKGSKNVGVLSPDSCSAESPNTSLDNTLLDSPGMKTRGSTSFNRRKPRSLRVKTDDDDGMCEPMDDDETGSPDEPLWTPGTAPATGMEDLFTGSGSVLPGESPGGGVGGGCLTSPGLGLGMADYFQAGVVPSSSHTNGDVDMSTADVTDSVLSAAEVASMMCGTPSQVLGRVCGCMLRAAGDACIFRRHHGVRVVLRGGHYTTVRTVRLCEC